MTTVKPPEAVCLFFYYYYSFSAAVNVFNLMEKPAEWVEKQRRKKKSSRHPVSGLYLLILCFVFCGLSSPCCASARITRKYIRKMPAVFFRLILHHCLDIGVPIFSGRVIIFHKCGGGSSVSQRSENKNWRSNDQQLPLSDSIDVPDILMLQNFSHSFSPEPHLQPPFVLRSKTRASAPAPGNKGGAKS